MLYCGRHHHRILIPHDIFSLYRHHNPRRHQNSRFFLFLRKPTLLFSLSALPVPPPPRPNQWIAQQQLPEPTVITAATTTTTTTTTTSAALEENGPIELPPSSPSTIFATTDDPSSLQVATSVLLTGAISIFLFRSVRRRVKRAKELRIRSSGTEKTLKDEALESLKAIGSAPIEAKKPSPVQAFLGGMAAAAIAIILYKFTTTIEASFNRQTMSDNYSVRQITITIRTIVNGLCYLATCVFGVNSIGLFLYSGQLALNSFTGDTTSENSRSKGKLQSDAPNSTPESRTEMTSSQGEQSPDNKELENRE